MASRIGRIYALRRALSLGARRMRSDLSGPLRKARLRTRSAEPFPALPRLIVPGITERGERIVRGHFEIGRHAIDVGEHGDPWSIAVPTERFAYHLHSFGWLADLAALGEERAGKRARYLVDRWIGVYGDWNAYAWDDDILTHRIFAWLTNWRLLLDRDGGSQTGTLRRTAVMRQVKHLHRIYRHIPHGPVRLKAAATLAMAGACAQDRSERYLDRGLDRLDEELDLQVLGDGGHVSRNPQAVLDTLEVLLSLDSVLEARGVQGSRHIRRAIDRLTPAAAFFTANDGYLFSFNGSGEGRTEQLSALRRIDPSMSDPFKYCPHTGYQRITQGETLLMIDSGNVPDHPYDLDAHIAPLAFEMATANGRLIVNCGWSQHQSEAWREPMRATAAHSTLVLNEQSAGRIIDRGLRAKVIGPAIAEHAVTVKTARRDQQDATWFEGAHNGYGADYRLTHRRRIYLSEKGHDLRGEDSLSLPVGEAPYTTAQIPFAVRFHLHPSVQVTLSRDSKSALLIQPGGSGWRFRTDGGPITIEPSVYLAAGHKPSRCEQIVIYGNAYGDGDGQARTNCVRWSLRKLTPRGGAAQRTER